MAHKLFFIWYIILLLVFGTFENAKAQMIRSFSTEPIQPSARAAAFADAYICDPYDVNSFYWNPASLTFLKMYSVVANSVMSWDRLIFRNNVAVPYRLGDDQTAALGVAANYFSRLAYYSLDLGYAKKLSPTVSAGIFLDLGYAASRSTERWVGSGSLGILYAPTPGISYGMVYKGLGTGVQYTNDGIKETLEFKKPKQSFLTGMTFFFPSINRRPYLIVSLTAEKILGTANFISKAGIEVMPFPFLAARFGILSSPIVATGRAGIGLYLSRFRIDYAISPSVAEDRLHQISIGVLL
jgi:hypothetical protein